MPGVMMLRIMSGGSGCHRNLPIFRLVPEKSSDGSMAPAHISPYPRALRAYPRKEGITGCVAEGLGPKDQEILRRMEPGILRRNDLNPAYGVQCCLRKAATPEKAKRNADNWTFLVDDFRRVGTNGSQPGDLANSGESGRVPRPYRRGIRRVCTTLPSVPVTTTFNSWAVPSTLATWSWSRTRRWYSWSTPGPGGV